MGTTKSDVKHAYHKLMKVHKVRKSCKSCNRVKDSENEHRFHGMGAFKRTHKGYCSIHCCGSQDHSPCYRKGQLKRKRKKRS